LQTFEMGNLKKVKLMTESLFQEIFLLEQSIEN